MNDLISRKDAIEHLKKRLWETALNNEGEAAEVFAEIADDRLDTWMAEIRPAQQWIPVSERLPEVRRSVILSTKNWTGEGCYWETTDHHVIWKGYKWNATYWDDEVIAWMPLPEPYKEVKYESHRK